MEGNEVRLRKTAALVAWRARTRHGKFNHQFPLLGTPGSLSHFYQATSPFWALKRRLTRPISGTAISHGPHQTNFIVRLKARPSEIDLNTSELSGIGNHFRAHCYDSPDPVETSGGLTHTRYSVSISHPVAYVTRCSEDFACSRWQKGVGSYLHMADVLLTWQLTR
jgi:hypothetical protein